MAARKKKGEELAIGALRIPLTSGVGGRLAGRDGMRIECSCTDERIESIDLFVETSRINVIVYSKSGYALPPDGENDMTVGGRNATKMHEQALKCHGRADLNLPHVQEKLREHVDSLLRRIRHCYCESCVDENEVNALRARVAAANQINLKSANADVQIDALLDAAGEDAALKGVP